MYIYLQALTADCGVFIDGFKGLPGCGVLNLLLFFLPPILTGVANFIAYKGRERHTLSITSQYSYTGTHNHRHNVHVNWFH